MKYLWRSLTGEVLKWIDRREIIAIKGPRQSGKTTLLKMINNYLTIEKKIPSSQIVFLTFEDRDILELFSKSPKEYIASYQPYTDKRVYFFIDEFQYLDDGGQKIKLLYDLFENVKFVITGSSSLEISESTSKYLVGRVFSFYLYQFSFSEFLKARADNFFNLHSSAKNEAWSFIEDGTNIVLKNDNFMKAFVRYLEEFVLYGGYPEVIKGVDLETKNIILTNIYDTYVTKDIIELLRISDVAGFRKILILLANQIGNMLNYNNIADDGESHFRRVKQYLSILEETFIIRQLRPYHKNKTTELKKSPKLFFVDTGLRNYLVRNFNMFDVRNDTGQLVENVVMAGLYERYPDDINYWRTLGQAEVDFIVRVNDLLIPIEVKYSLFKTPSVTRSMRNFITAYRPQRAVVLTKGYWGRIKIDNTNIAFIPVWYLI